MWQLVGVWLARASRGLALGGLCACVAGAPPVAAPRGPVSPAPPPPEPVLPYETVEQVRYRLLEEQDTDCDQKLTLRDQNSRRFVFRLLGQRYDYRGSYELSTLLQELSLARRSGAPPRLDRVGEDAVARTSRLIRTEYWPALTRRLDEDGLPGMLDDPKVQQVGQRMLYVPNDDARAYAYFRRAGRKYDAAYAALARATAGLVSSELNDAELTAMMRSPEGRENLAELSRRFGTAARALDYPGLSRYLLAALARLGDLLEQAGRPCVNTNSARLARLASRAREELARFAPKTLAVRQLPERERWSEWSAALGSSHGLLSLALEGKGDALTGAPFVVPGGRFNEMYGWDSYFILRGLLADDRLDLARGLVDNAIYVIEHYGATLNANRTYYLTRSQPPFMASMIRALWEAWAPEQRDPRWLTRAVRAAISEYDQVWRQPPRRSRVCRGEGDEQACLDHYAGLGRGQPPEVEPGHFDWLWQDLGRSLEQSYRAGELPARNLVRELDRAFAHDRCMRESGHDTTYRWHWPTSQSGGARAENRCADTLSVDLNSLLYRFEVDLAFLVGQLGAPLERSAAPERDAVATSLALGPDVWCARARHRLGLMKTHLWSARDGLFYDALLEPSGPVQTGYVSATTLYPLWAIQNACGAAPSGDPALTAAEKALLVTNALRQLEAPGGLLASARESRDRFSTQDDRQWDYPNGWAPHQMLAWEGLEANGFGQDAARLTLLWLSMIARNVVDYNGTIPEKYDVVARSHAVFSEYGNVGTDFDYITAEGFGWVNASFAVGLARSSPEERRRLHQSLSAGP
jgi:alpha,alpha-trehalase